MIPKQPHRIYVPIKEINAEGRIRQDYGVMQDLHDSLTKYGLLQPIVLNQAKQLIAGGRRLKAHIDLGETEIAAVFYETLDEVQLRMLEVEENVIRKDFDWKERVLAITVAHETAKRQSILGGDLKSWGQAQTGELLGLAVGNINNALKLASYIRNGDKDITGAESPTEAFKILLLRKEREAHKVLAGFLSAKSQTGAGITQAEATAILAKAEGGDEFFEATDVDQILGGSGGRVSAPSTGDEMPGGVATNVQPASSINLSQTILKGDSLEMMLTRMTPGFCDHIITDIPYGIDMEMLAQENASAGTKEQIGSIASEHGVVANKEDFEKFLVGSYRVLPDTGYCIFWMDIEHWEKLRDLAISIGFRVQRWPLVWHKTHTCKNQAAQYNFTKTTEIAMVARKGNATLIQPQGSSVWAGSNELERATLGHPFVKPIKLWQWIFNAVALKGQKLYDPYAGVGSMPLAAIESGYLPIASEINDLHFNRLVVNVANAYKQLNPNVVFV